MSCVKKEADATVALGDYKSLQLVVIVSYYISGIYYLKNQEKLYAFCADCYT
jgi:hypothetical protein